MSSIRAWRGYGGMEASRAQEIVAAAHRVPTTRREPSEARTKSRRKGKRWQRCEVNAYSHAFNSHSEVGDTFQRISMHNQLLYIKSFDMIIGLLIRLKGFFPEMQWMFQWKFMFIASQHIFSLPEQMSHRFRQFENRRMPGLCILATTAPKLILDRRHWLHVVDLRFPSCQMLFSSDSSDMSVTDAYTVYLGWHEYTWVG